MCAIPSKFDVPLPIPGVEGMTPEWFRAYKRVYIPKTAVDNG